MDATAKDFMSEVKDNFLTCQLCGKDFDKPKTLPCMHTFCYDCLIKYADDQKAAEENRQTYRYSTYCKPITCPVCRRRTDITRDDVASLPDNFLISSLVGIIKDKAEESTACQICKRGRHKGRKPLAVRRCLECNKQLCKRCVTQHQETKVTQAHTLYDLENTERHMCVDHNTEAVRFICKTCAKCICVFCTHTTHQGHEVTSILEGTASCQQEMEQMVDDCNQRIDTINGQLKFIHSWETSYQQTREHILSTATEFLTQIESQRQAFLSKLDEMFGAGVMEMLNKKDVLLESLDDLSSACKYKDIIPEGNSIESVLVQSELQNKVKTLLDIPLPVAGDFQSDITVTFEKGDLLLGSLLAIKEDDEERQEEYFDGFDERDGSRARSWCRGCRSQSRCKSLPAVRSREMLDTESGMTSDTDFSLTDVSQLDVNSSHQMLFGAGETEYMIPAITSDFGVQVDFLTDQDYLLGRSEDERTHFDIPDVVPHSVQTADNSSQYECHLTVDATSQYEPVEQPRTTQDSYSQYKNKTTDCAMSTDVIFYLGKEFDIGPHTGASGFNTTTNIPFTLAPSESIKHVTPTSDSASLTDMPSVSVDAATNTNSIKHIDASIETESKASKDIAVDKFVLPCCDQNTQTFIETPSVVTCETGSNTELSEHTEQETQTSHVVKQKSRGISVRPTVAEFGLDVKPTVSDSQTTTNVQAMCNSECQTDTTIAYAHQSTNTETARTQSIGTTAHLAGVNSCTTTQDLIAYRGSATQTQSDQRDSKEKSCNTVAIESKTASAGLDSPYYGVCDVGVSTDSPPKMAETSMNTVSVQKSDSWTNPAPTHRSSKACGTEQIRKRTVGLYVRPSQKDGFSMTATVKQADKGCGWSWAKTNDVGVGAAPTSQDQCEDTVGLLGFSDRDINTDIISTATHFSQTPVITQTDNFTMMMDAFLVDKSTNTPHQIPQEVLDQFQYPSPTAEYLNRTTQTDLVYDLAVPTVGVLSDSPRLSMTGTNQASSIHHNTSLSTQTETEHQESATSSAQPQPGTTTESPADSNPNTTKQRLHRVSSKSVTAKPVTWDKSTSTATLTTLLHTERLQQSETKMDSKITECITKLRQVTKKLQKSSTDITKISNSTCSSPTTEHSGFETPLSQFSAETTDDTELHEACSSILSLPVGYITGTSQDSTRRMSVPDHSSSHSEQGAVGGVSTPLSPRQGLSQTSSPSTPHNWDLKSLVHEEDRVRQKMVNSTPQQSRQTVGGNSSPSETQRLYRAVRRSAPRSNSSSRYSSRYNSTESLSQLDQDNSQPTQQDLSSSHILSPASSGRPRLQKTKSDASPVRQARVSGSPAARTVKKSVSKARSKHLDSAALLAGVEKIKSQTCDEQFHSLSKSMSSKPPTQSKSSKPISTALSPQKSSLKPQAHSSVHLPKQLVSSVVRKVQSLGRPKSPKPSLTDSDEKPTRKAVKSSAGSSRPQALELKTKNSESTKLKAKASRSPQKVPTQRESRGMTAGKRGIKASSASSSTIDSAAGMESSTESCGERLASHQEKDRSLGRNYSSTTSAESKTSVSKRLLSKPKSKT